VRPFAELCLRLRLLALVAAAVVVVCEEAVNVCCVTPIQIRQAARPPRPGSEARNILRQVEAFLLHENALATHLDAEEAQVGGGRLVCERVQVCPQVERLR
jgi:hypothetical protein